MRAESRAENKFPVLWNYRDPKPHAPQWVPWDWMEKFAHRAERNHGQTILRLAERGGLGASEIWCAVHDKGLWDEGIPTEAACGEWLRSEPWSVSVDSSAKIP